MSSGIPTASISGTTSGVATYLTGEGNLAVTNMAPLTIGGGSTGSITIDAGAGTINLSDNTNVTGNIDVSGNADIVGNLTAGGNIDFADTGADTITIGDVNDTTSHY